MPVAEPFAHVQVDLIPFASLPGLFQIKRKAKRGCLTCK